MEKLRKISPFRLSSLLRLEKDPKLAFQLFMNPNPNDPNPTPKPFRYDPVSYDLIITKLGKAKMFSELELIVENLKKQTRIIPKEIIFCNIISFYGRARLSWKALEMFDEIPSFRCRRTIKSVNSLLNSLLICREFSKMREVFLGMEIYARPDACTYNILINACLVMGDLDNAWDVFNAMQKKGIVPNVTTFGTLIKGLCENKELEEAFRLKEMMERDFKLKPNAFLFVALIKGLCEVDKVDVAMKLKEEMLKKNVELDAAIYATLISALFKAGRREDVNKLLEDMRKNGCKKNTVLYNVIIQGCCIEQDFDSAFKVLNKMERRNCKPDIISYNVIIHALCKAGKLKEASELVEDMPRRKCFPDMVTYRTFFDGLCDAMQYKEAAHVLDEMVFKGYLPRSSSICNLVDGLIRGGKTKYLWMVLDSLAKGNFSNPTTWEMVVSFVCKGDRQYSNPLEELNSLITQFNAL
ncbi:OLC1v1023270C1 [Oldenlandia corymbosa var. corymbosa]|uniref:OLC1v1023270C1 n=1 Tax=Oldenlandia corymbosa var. corymbosa TaxID=529605 RepID=A0AAV1BZX8_OLDCO|nr:OLC1v1023270C1 [Oldenlandia corymbosa var. corymbosa]